MAISRAWPASQVNSFSFAPTSLLQRVPAKPKRCRPLRETFLSSFFRWLTLSIAVRSRVSHARAEHHWLRAGASVPLEQASWLTDGNARAPAEPSRVAWQSRKRGKCVEMGG